MHLEPRKNYTIVLLKRGGTIEKCYNVVIFLRRCKKHDQNLTNFYVVERCKTCCKRLQRCKVNIANEGFEKTFKVIVPPQTPFEGKFKLEFGLSWSLGFPVLVDMCILK